MKKQIVPKLQRKTVVSALDEGERLDGRDFYEYRDIEIKTGELGRAEGSAIAKIGNTQVACGVKIGTGEPYPDSPDEGILRSGAELVPLASSLFETGPPREEAIELARVVDRGIRESGAIDFSELCITPGEEVMSVAVDSYVLDHDGNFMDTSALGAIAALWDTEIPDFGKLPIKKKPIANTFAKINDHIILDPVKEEEEVLDARLTIAIEDNNKVCAMQKGGSGYWMKDEVLECVDVAVDTTKELRKLLK
ncbi:MAG: exosome complex protein Rrp42 [Candidatus Undinarchaeales archaeon]